MLYIELNPVSFFLAVAIAHIGYVLIGWFIHFLAHRKVLGLPFYKIHLNAHHSPEEVAKLSFSGILEHATTVLLLSVYCLVCCLILCNWLASIFVAAIVINSAIAYYLHEHYAISTSWLNRYEWFKHHRQLHQIHHRYVGEQFSESKNYCFGGLMGYTLDRLVGTFEPLNSAKILQ